MYLDFHTFWISSDEKRMTNLLYVKARDEKDDSSILYCNLNEADLRVACFSFLAVFLHSVVLLLERNHTPLSHMKSLMYEKNHNPDTATSNLTMVSTFRSNRNIIIMLSLMTNDSRSIGREHT